MIVLLTAITKLLHLFTPPKQIRGLFEWQQFPMLFVFGLIFCDVLQHKVEALRLRTGLKGNQVKG
jgi:hypothetical protein